MKLLGYFKNLIVVTTVLLIISCNDEGSNINPVPTPIPIVTSLSPNFGPVGTLVTVRGSNLLNLDSVKIGKTRVNVISAIDSVLSFTVPNTATTGKVYFYKGSIADSSQLFTVILSNALLTEYSATLLVPPLAGNQSATFFSTRNGKTYSFTSAAEGNNSDSVDIGYFYSSNFGAMFASPANYPLTDSWASLYDSWKTYNITTFKSVNSGNNSLSTFSGITKNGQIDSAYSLAFTPQVVGSSGIAGERIGNLSVGDLFIVMNSNNKKAMVYIQSISFGNGSFGNITIRVKSQN